MDRQAFGERGDWRGGGGDGRGGYGRVEGEFGGGFAQDVVGCEVCDWGLCGVYDSCAGTGWEGCAAAASCGV